MKNNYPFLIVLSTLLFVLPCRADEWIRINQLGYLPRSIKVAVFMSEEESIVENYTLVDAFTNKVVQTFHAPRPTGQSGSMKTTYRLDFSDFTTPTT